MSDKTRKKKPSRERSKRKNARATSIVRLRAVWKDRKQRPLIIFLAIICIVILGTAIYGITTIVSGAIASPTIPEASTSVTSETHNTPPLVISDTRIVNMTESSATITWSTSNPAISELEYWISGATDRSTVSSDKLTTNHSIELAALRTDATYNYRVKSVDTVNNLAAERIGTFTLAIGPEVGKRAPDFTLTSLDGKAITLSDYRGTLVILDFWVWSCSACKTKLYIIQDTLTRMPADKVVVLGIHAKEKEPIIRNFVTNNRLTVPVLLDPDEAVRQLYNVSKSPTLFFLDRDGIIRLIDAKFNSVEELRDVINTVLGAN